jgi:hypothetical protein
MADDLIRSRVLVGMSEREVEVLLGAAGREGPHVLRHELGFISGQSCAPAGVDAGSLLLYLNEAGEVERVEAGAA